MVRYILGEDVCYVGLNVCPLSELVATFLSQGLTSGERMAINKIHCFLTHLKVCSDDIVSRTR
jgi:hypothetical protein